MQKLMLTTLTVLFLFNGCSEKQTVCKPTKLKTIKFNKKFTLKFEQFKDGVYTIKKSELDKCIKKAVECKYKLEYLNKQIEEYNNVSRKNK